MATPLTTSNNIKYEILQEEDDGETSEEGSEIIIITPIHSDPEDGDNASVIVLSPENNNNSNNPTTIGPNPHTSITAQHLYHLANNNNNDDDDNIASYPSSMSALPSISPSLPPPPPYEGTEASAHTNNGTTTLFNFSEDSTEDQNFIRLLMVSYYPGIIGSSNPKMFPRDGATLSGHGLPSYDVATDLPSYEEAERTKEEEEMRLAEQQIDLQEDERNNVDSNTTDHLTSMAIGTDWTFLYTFIISFLFNWIGFLLSLCITSTVSGRCGALSGLGLSVVKWVAIVRHSNWASGFAEEESWLWWSLMICGFLLFIRGCVQYIHIKYEWKKIATRIQQLYFF